MENKNAQIKAYKGFDKDLKCRGFQYEIGKTYHCDGPIELCKNGFHAIHENASPLSVFDHYPPAKSRYCEVFIGGETKEYENTIVGSDITIGVEVGIDGIVNAHEEWVENHVIDDEEHKASNMGGCSLASNTGNRSSASNTGKFSSASNKDYLSSASNTGDCSSASNTGDCSSASNTGRRSSASNKGYFSSASNTGEFSSASNTGQRSSASNTGNYSSASNTGQRSSASNTGNYSSAEVSGKDSVAIVTGKDSKARGSLGCAIVVAERGKWNGVTHPLIGICSAIVDGVKIKADTWYTAKNGQLVEVNEVEE